MISMLLQYLTSVLCFLSSSREPSLKPNSSFLKQCIHPFFEMKSLGKALGLNQLYCIIIDTRSYTNGGLHKLRKDSRLYAFPCFLISSSCRCKVTCLDLNSSEYQSCPMSFLGKCL
uniref:Uncharacterized protein n=1 Tax=Micrurus lemniscatus lemniscatus TaxID=129467 RepID=A0A2D4HL57_MICLE